MGPRPPLWGVQKTALGIALIRARESQREDRLFDDPYAQAFLDASPAAFLEESRTRGKLASRSEYESLGALFYAQAVIRTRFFDDCLLAATAAGCHQVVLLAAGLDTRAFRLIWPEGTCIFELDLPGVLEYKEQVLAGERATPRCKRITVSVDLVADWSRALVTSGFDATAAAVWLAEGLMIYLSQEEVESLLSTIGKLSSPGSQLAFEQGSIAGDELLNQARGIPAVREYTALWKGSLRQDGAAWLDRHGWRQRTHELTAVATSYGRDLPSQTQAHFVTAERVDDGGTP